MQINFPVYNEICVIMERLLLFFTRDERINSIPDVTHCNNVLMKKGILLQNVFVLSLPLATVYGMNYMRFIRLKGFVWFAISMIFSSEYTSSTGKWNLPTAHRHWTLISCALSVANYWIHWLPSQCYYNCVLYKSILRETYS